VTAGGVERPDAARTWIRAPVVASFLLESYVPKVAEPAPGELTRRLDTAAQALGSEVRYVRAIFVPEDETCFYFFEGPSAEAVRLVAARAGLRYERILRARP
jgi:hypothetical protein